MIRSLVPALLALRSKGGPGGRLSILIFHRVLPEPDPLFPGEVDAARFGLICRCLREWFNVLALDEGVSRLAKGTLPPRAAAITFDDGYADNHDLALPILQRHGLTATFFIATGFLDGGRMWNDTVIEALRRTLHDELDLNGLPGCDLGRHSLASTEDRRRAVHDLLPRIKHLPAEVREQTVAEVARRAAARLPDDLMMTSGQVRALHHAGMGIGAHTQSHPILAGLDDGTARAEMRQSRDRLQELLDAPVPLFAYPNGKPGRDYGPRAVAIARELGFIAAVSTAPGVAHSGSDPMQLPRFTPWRTTPLAFASQLLGNLGQTASAAA
jgi:peptidoglycan/xylan/chitin deacetylase (PgdA/CDA1 family)